MPIDPRISLGVQPLQLADPLAQYGQMQNILAAQSQQRAAGTQQQAAELQMQQSQRQIQQDEDYVAKMAEVIGKNGGPTDMMQAARVMAGNRNAQVSATGIQMLQSLQRLDAAKKAGVYGAVEPKISPVAPAPGAVGSGTFDTGQPPMLSPREFIDQPLPAQASFGVSTLVKPQARATPSVMAAPPPAPVNQLAPAPATPQANVNALRNEYMKLSEFSDLPGVKDRMDLIKAQLDEANKLYTVGGNLVTGIGKSIFTAPEKVTPTEIKKLTAERDALPLTDPNRRLYDQAIANLGSTERLAQERLNFDRNKFAYEKANPGYTIQQAEDGSVVGVNNRTLQYFPVTLGGTSPPPAAPFAGGGGAPGGAGKRGGVVAPTTTPQPVNQPQGVPLKGKSAGLTESQGNATAFGLRMQESHSTLKDLESKGETSTGVIGGTVGGVVGLVPLIGDKLTAGVDNIYNVLPQVMGGYSPEQQKIMNGRINFITAVLRKESGAAISPGEFVTAEKLYFSRPGDDPSVIKQKQRARELAIKAMKIQAGPGAKSIEETTPSTSGATSASDPLGLFPAKKP